MKLFTSRAFFPLFCVATDLVVFGLTCTLPAAGQSCLQVKTDAIGTSEGDSNRETITTVAPESGVAPPAPLQCLKMGTSVHPEGGAAIELQVINLSDNVAIAWVFTSRHFGRDGSVVSRSFKVVVLPEETNSGLTPGASWLGTLHIPSADGRAVDHDLVLDYVLFSDRSSWGPDTGGFSRHIAGQMQARRVERARLREILERQGVQALTQELSREAAP